MAEMRTLKRYRNRRLYDPASREQVTLAHVRDLVQAGTAFRVEDNATGRDVTVGVLVQVLAEDVRHWRNVEETVTLLRLLIRRGGDTGMTILSKTVLAAIGALAITKENAEKWVDELIKRGELDKSKRAAAVKEAVDKAEQRAKETVQKVGRSVSAKVKEVEKGIGKRFSKSEEVAELRRAVDDLAAKVEELKSRLS
jgi:polyhydroxyalkanoate synthesis repressor PhaR